MSDGNLTGGNQTIVLGSCRFPVTSGTGGTDVTFGRFLTVVVTTVPLPNLSYLQFEGGPNKESMFRCQGDLMKREHTTNNDGMFSILSAFNAMGLALGMATPRRKYISVPDWLPELTKMGGASLGLATLVALLGYIVPDNVAVTGFVTTFGSSETGMQPLRMLPVDGVDHVGVKARGALDTGVSLLYPMANEADVVRAMIGYMRVNRPYETTPVILAVSNIGEVMDWLHARGCRSRFVDS